MDQHRLDRLLASLHRFDAGVSVLHRICLVCVDVTSTAGAGVSRIVDGQHDVLGASGPLATDIEGLQLTLTEGPCRDAVASFKPSLEPDLASTGARRRWPHFATRAAVEQGVAATFEVPLITGGVAIGALDVYATEAGDLQHEQVEDTMVLAGLAGLAVERFGRSTAIAGVDLAAEPADDWAHAAIVHNASGMVSEQLDIDVDEALLRIRAVAFATDRRVSMLRADVVERTMRIESWDQHG